MPTPAVPELAEAPNEVFDRLGEVIKPEVRHVRVYTFAPVLLLEPFLPMLSSEAGGDFAERTQIASVRILHRQRVAGYDAVVLEADDPKALAEWLRSHECRDEVLESRPGVGLDPG